MTEADPVEQQAGACACELRLNAEALQAAAGVLTGRAIAVAPVIEDVLEAAVQLTNCVVEHGPLSTAEIATRAGRSQATVRESWVRPLVEAGVVVAIDERLTKADGWRRRRYALADGIDS